MSETRPPDITVVSTYTRDRMTLPDGGVQEIPGGPAYYVGQALDRLGCAYAVVTGERALVDVIPGPSGEDYLIPALPEIALPARLLSPVTILSPIMQEIDPDGIPPCDGRLVVDLQGFVREPGTPFFTVRRLFDLTALIRRAYLVKGAPEEFKRLSDASQRALRETNALVTFGRRGSTLVQNGHETHVPAHQVEVEHAIGAGDMLLAAIVAYTLDGDSLLSATQRATQFVAQELRGRAAPQQWKAARIASETWDDPTV